MNATINHEIFISIITTLFFYCQTETNISTPTKANYVAVGDNNSASYSVDGVVWYKVQNMPLNGGSINAITVGKDRFIAVGDNGKAAYSTNGITWTAILKTEVNNNNINDISFGNNQFVMIANNGNLSFSNDGILWFKINELKFNNTSLISITYNNQWVIWGTKGIVGYTEQNLQRWSVSNNTDYSQTNIFNSTVCNIANQNLFCAVGDQATLIFSRNGMIWQKIYLGVLGGATIYDLANNKNILIATSNEGKLIYSDDSINWELKTNTTLTKSIRTIEYGKDIFIIAGENGKGAYSKDGLNWIAIDNMQFGNNTIYDIGYKP